MNKSILVIDTPDSCRDCAFRCKDMDIGICGATGRVIYDEIIDRVVSKYCPLRLVPERKIGDNSIKYQWGDYEDGWNHCIDMIVGL